MTPKDLVLRATTELYRNRDLSAAEHWDIVFAKPETLPHGNTLF